MQIGDLVTVSEDWSELGFCGMLGVVTNIYQDPEGECGGRMVTVLWENGVSSEEWFVALEAV